MENRAYQAADEAAKGNLGLTVFMVVQAAAFILLFIFFDRIDWAAIWRFFTPALGQILGIALLTAAGFVLYILRNRQPYLYAGLEIGVAEVAIWSALGARSSSGLEASLKISAGVYLLVRGLDNWNAGPERTKKAAERRAQLAAEKQRRREEAAEAAKAFRREHAAEVKQFLHRAEE